MNETRQPVELTASGGPLPWSDDRRPELQTHYIGRLRRLLQLRQAHLGELNQEGVWLLDRSIFATYCDCVEVGAGLAAQDALRSQPSAEGPGTELVGPMRRPRRT